MSVENVKKFYEAVSQDEVLKQKFGKLSQKSQGQLLDKAKVRVLMEQEVLPQAAQLGLPFSFDDFNLYEAKLRSSLAQTELKDEELQAVSGGVSPQIDPYWIIACGYPGQIYDGMVD